MTARDTYVDNIKRELDALNYQLSSFETKVTHTRHDAQMRYTAALATLRSHSCEALATWEALRTTSDEPWHQWVSDMDRARDAYVHAFQVFRADL